jgi:hypothetical protein
LSVWSSVPKIDHVVPPSVETKNDVVVSGEDEGSGEHLHGVNRIDRDARLGVLIVFAAVGRRDDVDDAQKGRGACGVRRREHKSYTPRRSVP